MSEETELQNKIRRALSPLGCRLFRNQVGLYRLPDRRMIHSGLAVGSSDLIGWTMVGGRAIFTSIEVKLPGRKPTAEQRDWLIAVAESGGIAFIAHSVDEAKRLLEMCKTLAEGKWKGTSCSH